MSKKKKNDLTAKILALLIAIILWSYVMGEVNPETVRTYKDIKVEYINESNLDEDGLILLEPKEPTISVEISGKKSDVDKFSENVANNISARVDLSNVEVGKNYLRVEIKLINNVSNIKLVDYEPREMVVLVDEIAEEEYEVIGEVEGELEEDSVIGELKVEPSRVKIRGPKSYLNKIHQVSAKLDIQDKNTSFTKSVPLEILDIDGNNIRGLVKNPNLVNIGVQIYQKKFLPINVKTKGEVPAGYSIKDFKLDPNLVEVKILDKKLDVESINMKPMDFKDLIGKQSVEVDLDLPEGIELVNPKEKILLKYNILETGSKTITINKDKLDIRNIPDGLDLDFNSIKEEYMVVVDESISDDELDSIKIFVDLKDLEAGQHRVEVQIDENNGELVKSIIPKNIDILLKESS